MYRVYLITNKVTGRYYVGQTEQSLEERWKFHCYYNCNPLLKEDINIFGQESFKMETLCVCPDKPSMDKAEKFFIKFLGSHKRSLGYNRNTGRKTARAFTTKTEKEILSIVEKKKKEGSLRSWIDYGMFKLPEHERLAYEKVLKANRYIK